MKAPSDMASKRPSPDAGLALAAGLPPVGRRQRLPRLTPTSWITAEKFAQQALWLVLFVLLAPILGPRPYGLFSLTMVVVGFCELVLTEVAAEALLSVETMTGAHLATANLCNLLVGAGAAAGTALAAGPVAAAFHQPVLRWMFYALTPLPVLSAFMSTPTAVLKRDGRFGPFAARSILGLALGGMAGVVAALLGAGVWALVIQVLLQRVAEVSILSASAPRAFRFGWTRASFKDLRGCAANVLAARALTWTTGQAPRLIVGALLGPTLLGMFTLATRIADILAQVVLSPPVVVARVQMRQFADERAGLETAFDDLLRGLSFIAFPIAAGLAAVTPALFQVWLGHRWRGAEAASQLTVLAIAPSVLFYCTTAVLMGLRLSRLEVVIQAVISLSAVLIAWRVAPLGLNALCQALLLRYVLLLALPLWVLKAKAGLSIRAAWSAMRGSAASAALMGLAVSSLVPFVASRAGQPAALAAGVTAGAVLYAGLACLFERRQFDAWRRRLTRAVAPPEPDEGRRGQGDG